MKIAGSNIEMNSQHTLVKEYSKQESLQYWQDESVQDGTKKQLQGADQLQISKEAKQALKQNGSSQLRELYAGGSTELELSDAERRELTLLEKMLSVILGREFKFKIPHKIVMDEQQQPVLIMADNDSTASETQVKVGWGFAYDCQETYYESEKLSFETQGVVKTADGREIDFQINLNMSREFYRQSNIQIRAGDAQLCDPLVINYDGMSAGLTDTKYSFDLDCNGDKDQISFANAGSGFLAIDSNNDGKVTDGSELFGPSTGNGFEELAEYDQDQNGWIDENDAVFQHLRIWTKDQNGNDKLFALGQQGVGAIYLGNVSAQFGYKNNQNELQGQAQTAGVFLKEDGTPGIMQQVDLVV